MKLGASAAEYIAPYVDLNCSIHPEIWHRAGRKRRRERHLDRNHSALRTRGLAQYATVHDAAACVDKYRLPRLHRRRLRLGNTQHCLELIRARDAAVSSRDRHHGNVTEMALFNTTCHRGRAAGTSTRRVSHSLRSSPPTR